MYILLNKGYVAGEDHPSTQSHALRVASLKIMEYKKPQLCRQKILFGNDRSGPDAEPRVRRNLSVRFISLRAMLPLAGRWLPYEPTLGGSRGPSNAASFAKLETRTCNIATQHSTLSLAKAARSPTTYKRLNIYQRRLDSPRRAWCSMSSRSWVLNETGMAFITKN